MLRLNHVLLPLLAAGVIVAPAPAHAIAMQQGSADALWREAQSALNNDNYRRAVDVYGDLLQRYPGSTHAADATYYRALARFRIGGRTELATALDELDKYQSTYRDPQLADDAGTLRTRVCGELMKSGDERCGKEVVASASTGRRGARTAGAYSGTAGGSSVAGGTGSSVAGRGRSSNNGHDDDENDDVRMMALNALLQMNSAQAVPLLKDVLARRDTGSAKLREKAVFLLSQKQSPEVVDILLDAAQHDPDENVRSQAVFWMSQAHDPRVVTVLEQLLLKSSDSDLQNKAVYSLSQLQTDRAREILRDYATRSGGTRDVRRQAIFWLGQSAGPNNATFLRDLYGQLSDHDLKDQVISSLGQSSAGRPVLLDIAKNSREDAELRMQAIFWIGQSGATADLVSLYGTLTEPDLRDKVIFGLSQSRGPGAIEKLIDIAQSDSDKHLRSQAVFWIGQSSDPRAVKFLRDLISKE